MANVIIAYKPPNKSKSVQISRALNGYKDRSNYGKYFYERKGLLEKIPYRKLAKNVLILREEDHKKLINILQKYEAEYYAGFVEKSSETGEILSR